MSARGTAISRTARAFHPVEWPRTALMLPAALLLVALVVVPVGMLA